MKRRKRKRSSKTEGSPKTPRNAEKTTEPSVALGGADRQAPPGDEFILSVEAENPASNSIALAAADDRTPPADNFIAAVETEEVAEPPLALSGADYVTDLADELMAAVEEERSASDSVTLAEADHHTPPGDEFIAAVETEKAAEPPTALGGTDRRTHPRYEFTAAVEVIAVESGARMETRLGDLSQQGCYVDTNKPLPLGTVIDVRITKGPQLFAAPARVVYSRAGKGMGLVFTAIEPGQRETLGRWVAESRETSWLAANRRRSQRVLMTIPVRVSGKTGAGLPFEEETHTRAISAHGALIPMSTQVQRGQRLILSNVHTKAALECVVAHIDRSRGEHLQAGVEFTLPNPMFWHVAFPPRDWTPRHPHAKSRLKTGGSG